MITMVRRVLIVACCFAASVPTLAEGQRGSAPSTTTPSAGAQASPADAPAAAAKVPDELKQLRIDVVLSRYQGDKKIASLPYTLYVFAGPSPNAVNLRLGLDVPERNLEPMAPVGSNYHIGTKIDSTVSSTSDARFRIYLSVEDSSLYVPEATATGTPAAAGVSVRTLTASSSLLMRDGQTIPFTIGTDKISGETMKGEVTVTVLK